jgi:uncharacterized membrane protein YbjE (DUF340 family)
MDTEIIIALGIFLGCLLRAILPYLKKKHEAVQAGQQIQWESRYVWTLCFTLVVSLITTILIIPTFQIPLENAFPLAFAFGWASQDIVNKVAG